MKYWELTIYYDINSEDKPPFEDRDSVTVRHKSLKTVCERARYFYRSANICRDWILLTYRDSKHNIIYQYECWKGASSISKTLLTKMGVKYAADVQKKS